MTTTTQTTLLETLIALAVENGGATLLANGQEANGFVVGGEGFASHVFDPLSFDEAAAHEWIAKVNEAGANLGSWLDHETGLIHLDAVRVVQERETAVALCEARGELAYFDTAALDEVRVPAIA